MHLNTSLIPDLGVSGIWLSVSVINGFFNQIFFIF